MAREFTVGGPTSEPTRRRSRAGPTCMPGSQAAVNIAGAAIAGVDLVAGHELGRGRRGGIAGVDLVAGRRELGAVSLQGSDERRRENLR